MGDGATRRQVRDSTSRGRRATCSSNSPSARGAVAVAPARHRSRSTGFLGTGVGDTVDHPRQQRRLPDLSERRRAETSSTSTVRRQRADRLRRTTASRSAPRSPTAAGRHRPAPGHRRLPPHRQPRQQPAHRQHRRARRAQRQGRTDEPRRLSRRRPRHPRTLGSRSSAPLACDDRPGRRRARLERRQLPRRRDQAAALVRYDGQRTRRTGGASRVGRGLGRRWR